MFKEFVLLVKKDSPQRVKAPQKKPRMLKNPSIKPDQGLAIDANIKPDQGSRIKPDEFLALDSSIKTDIFLPIKSSIKSDQYLRIDSTIKLYQYLAIDLGIKPTNIYLLRIREIGVEAVGEYSECHSVLRCPFLYPLLSIYCRYAIHGVCTKIKGYLRIMKHLTE